jgi:hypothetical protein
MRTREVLALGAIVGTAVVWLWRREIEAYVKGTTRRGRTKAAENIRAVEEEVTKALDRGGDAVRGVGDFLEDVQGDVSKALRAGPKAVRPAAAAKKA